MRKKYTSLDRLRKNRFLSNWVWDVIPESVAAGFATFSFGVITLLLVDSFKSGLLLLIVLPIAVLTTILVANRLKDTNEYHPGDRIYNVLAIIFVIAWMACNVFFTSQHLLTNRDPGIYAVTGAWLADNESVRIPAPTVATNNYEGVKAESRGMYTSIYNKDEINPHGNHLLPGLLGSAARIIGKLHMLRVPVVFGGLALLMVFAFARKIMSPAWALYAMAVLSLSLPMLYFSRDTYTEPLMMVFVFGGLSLLWRAMTERSMLLWFMSGLVVGATSLARVDAWLIMAGIVGGVFVYLAGTPKTEHNKRGPLLFFLAMAGVSALSWLDLTKLSSVYYIGQRDEFLKEVVLLALVVVFGLILWLVASHTKLLHRVSAGKIKKISAVVFWGILIVAALLASRQWWYVARGEESRPLVGGLQVAAGNLPDPTRTYAEATASWFVWYLGIFIVVLGVLGLATLARLAIENKQYKTAPMLAVFVITTSGYMLFPSIVPDQIWAIRRFLPVTLPLLVVLATYFMQQLSNKSQTLSRIRLRVAVIAVIAVLPIAITTAPLALLRDTAQAKGVLALCQSLPENSVVVWVGDAGNTMVQATQSYCGVESVSYAASELARIDKVSMEQSMATIQAAIIEQGKVPIFATYQRDVDGYKMLFSDYAKEQRNIVSWSEYGKSLYGPPRRGVKQAEVITIIKVNE